MDKCITKANSAQLFNYLVANYNTYNNISILFNQQSMSKLSFLLITLLLLANNGLFSQSIQKRNCGTMNHLSEQLKNDPGLADRMNQIEQQTARFTNNMVSATSTISIPVVFHIVYNTSAQNISDAQCIAQLNQLNLDYAKLNPCLGISPS